jgi:hypothetical protein
MHVKASIYRRLLPSVWSDKQRCLLLLMLLLLPVLLLLLLLLMLLLAEPYRN